MSKSDIFGISKADVSKYKTIAFEYYSIYKGKDSEEAKRLGDALFKKIISGKTLKDKKLAKFEHFDEILSELTEHYYIPTTSYRYKYPANGSKSKGVTTEKAELTAEEQRELVEAKKADLLSEYPALARRDLGDIVDNYCTLHIQLKHLLSKRRISENALAVKNITHTLVQLGSFLGIDEGAKAKQKDAEDLQSIASLSVKFQQTLKDYPEIHKRMLYKELRICLEKYERSEISREIFESRSWAGMTVSAAREFVAEHEAEYEAS